MVTGGIEVPGGIQRVPGVPGVADPVELAKWMAEAGLADLGELRGVQLIPCAQAWLAMVQALPQPQPQPA